MIDVLKKKSVLVVDRDPQTYRVLDIVLDREEFNAVQCASGKRAIQLCVSMKPDIMLLDLDLPDMKSEDLIAAIRQWSRMPVIIVSARDTNDEVIKGLEMGADDYVTKPFNADVLRARITASLRKSATGEADASELINGPLRIDLARHQVFLGGELIAFTPKEYSLLCFLTIHCGKMLGHKELLREVWGAAHSDDTQYLRVFVGQLREKLEADPSNPVMITTELGIGYRMEFLHELSSCKQSSARV